MMQVVVITACILQVCYAGLSLPTLRIGSSGAGLSMGGSSAASLISSLGSSSSGSSQSSSFTDSMPRIRFSGGKPSIVVGKHNYISPSTSSSQSNSSPRQFHPMRYPMMNPMMHQMMNNRYPMMGHQMQPWAAASMKMQVRMPFPLPVMPMAKRFRGWNNGFGNNAAASGFNSMYNNHFSSGFSMETDRFAAEDDNTFKMTEYKIEDGSSYKPENDVISEYKPATGDENYKPQEESKNPQSEYKSLEQYKPQGDNKPSEEYPEQPEKDAYGSLTGQQDDGNTDYLTLVGKQISLKNPKTGKMKYQTVVTPKEGTRQPYTGKAQTFSTPGAAAYYGDAPSVTETPKYELPAEKCPPCPERDAYDDDRDDEYERPRKSKKYHSFDEDDDDDDYRSSVRMRRRPSPNHDEEEDDCGHRMRRPSSSRGRSGRKTLQCRCHEETNRRRNRGGKTRGKRSAEGIDRLLLTPEKRVLKIPSPKPTLTLDDKGEVVGSISKAIAEALERNSEVYSAIGASRQARKVDEIVKVVENPQYHLHRPVIHKNHHIHASPHHDISHHPRGLGSHASLHHPFALQDPLVSLLLQ